MLPDTHRTQVLKAVGPEKAAQKIQKTVIGIAFMSVGVLAVLVSFALVLRMVWTGSDITVLGVILVLLMLCFGLALSIIGAHQWSSELVTAGVKDVGSLFGGLLRIWKRGGS